MKESKFTEQQALDSLARKRIFQSDRTHPKVLDATKVRNFGIKLLSAMDYLRNYKGYSIVLPELRK